MLIRLGFLCPGVGETCRYERCSCDPPDWGGGRTYRSQDQRERLFLSAICSHLMCKVAGSSWLGRVGLWLPWCSWKKMEFCWISERCCLLIIRTNTMHLLENVLETFMGCPQVSWGLGLFVLVPVWRHKIQPPVVGAAGHVWHAVIVSS